MQVVVCSKNKILLILVLFINTTISFSSSAKADVKVEKIDKVLNWDDTDFYRDADINIQLAKKIKQERKRRVELKNKGYSNKDINRILKEEKEKNILTTQNNGINQKQQHNGTDDNVEDVFGNEDDDEEEEEYVLVRKKKKNGKVINKKNKAYIIDEDNYDRFAALVIADLSAGPLHETAADGEGMLLVGAVNPLIASAEERQRQKLRKISAHDLPVEGGEA